MFESGAPGSAAKVMLTMVLGLLITFFPGYFFFCPCSLTWWWITLQLTENNAKQNKIKQSPPPPEQANFHYEFWSSCECGCVRQSSN